MARPRPEGEPVISEPCPALESQPLADEFVELVTADRRCQELDSEQDGRGEDTCAMTDRNIYLQEESATGCSLWCQRLDKRGEL